MSWEVKYSAMAQKDLMQLDGSVRARVNKGIEKVAQNPISKFEGGYGEPLGNKRGIELTGLYKIKFKSIGIRVVYELKKIGNEMLIIIISVRDDDEVYIEAEKRKKENDLM